MSDHRDALEDILHLCNTSRTYTRRTQQIHEVAMRALGMTAGQRRDRHVAIMERIGGDGDPAKAVYLAREVRREARWQAKPTTGETL